MTWEARLLRARKTGKFSDTDKRMVGAWPTCAIGERYHLKPTQIGLGDSDVDSHAENLGLEFMHAVKADNVYEAVKIYDTIMAYSY